jgi:hypothetical protein
MALKLTTTSKGNQSLIFDSFSFRKDKLLKSGAISWRCMTKGCKASIKTNTLKTVILDPPTQHNHVSDLCKSENSAQRIVDDGLGPSCSTPPPMDMSNVGVSSPSLTELLAPFNVHLTPVQPTFANTDEENLHLQKLVSELKYQKEALTNKCIELESRLLDCDKSSGSRCDSDASTQTDLSLDSVSSELIESLRVSVEVLEAENVVLRAESTKQGELRSHRYESTTNHPIGDESGFPETVHTTRFSVATKNRFECLSACCEESDSVSDNQWGVSLSSTNYIKNSRRVKSAKKRCKRPNHSIIESPSISKSLSGSSVSYTGGSIHTIKKFRLFADSQGREITDMLRPHLNRSIQSMAYVLPGASLEHVLEVAENDTEVKSMGPDDHVMILAGTNNFNRDTTEDMVADYLWRFDRFISRICCTSLIVATVPYRYDQHQESIINIRIKLYNKLLRSLVNQRENVSIVETNDFYRRFHTTHGLHINKFGRRELVRRIVRVIESSFFSFPYYDKSSKIMTQSREMNSPPSSYAGYVTIDETYETLPNLDCSHPDVTLTDQSMSSPLTVDRSGESTSDNHPVLNVGEGNCENVNHFLDLNASYHQQP